MKWIPGENIVGDATSRPTWVAAVAAILAVALTAAYDRITISAVIASHETRIHYLEQQYEDLKKSDAKIMDKLDSIKDQIAINAEKLKGIDDRQKMVLNKLNIHLGE